MLFRSAADVMSADNVKTAHRASEANIVVIIFFIIISSYLSEIETILTHITELSKNKNKILVL